MILQVHAALQVMEEQSGLLLGDVIAHERVLPEIQSGDYIVAHDTGGYYYSSYCYYNLRTAPPIYSFDSNPQVFSVVKEAKTVEETIQFFS